MIKNFWNNLEESTRWAIIMSSIFISLTTIILVILAVFFRPEIYDDALIFNKNKITTINETQFAIAQIQSVDSYSNGKSGNTYYAFTNNGRLVIYNKGISFNRTLYNEVKDFHLDEYCLMEISISWWQTDWRAHSFDCSIDIDKVQNILNNKIENK